MFRLSLLPRALAFSLFGFVASAGHTFAQAPAGAGWQWLAPATTSLSAAGAARFGDRWIIVGERGSVHSLDATGRLEANFLPAAVDLKAVVNAQGKLVAVGRSTDSAGLRRNPAVWISRDGRTWESRTGLILGDSLTFADGKFVTTAAQQICTSTDGETWTLRPTFSQWSLNQTAFGNGLWVAVGTAGSLYTSPDAITWSARTSGTTCSLRGVAWQNGRWVAGGENFNGFNAGELITSTDGISWSRAMQTETRINDVRVYRGMFVAIGDQGPTLVSADGVRWSPASTDQQSGFLALAIDGNDSLVLGRYGQIFTSRPDAIRWNRLPTGSRETFRGVDYAAGSFIAVSEGFDPFGGGSASPIHTSPDGFTWTKWAPPRTGIALFGISHNEQVIVTVGNAGVIFTSTDGLAWTQRLSGLTGAFQAVASSPNAHVAVGDRGMIYHSTDAATWTRITSPTASTLRTITHGLDGFVAAGEDGVVLTSRDGLQWTRRNSGTTFPLYTATWINGLGYFVGTVGTVLRSPDGVTWVAERVDGQQLIMAMAGTPLGLLMNVIIEDVLLRSRDTRTFIRDELRLGRALRGFASGPGAIVAVGDSGTMLVHPLATDTRSRLANMSIRTTAGTGDNSLIVGLGVGGEGTQEGKSVLIRAVGPTLSAFDVPGALTDPTLAVFRGQTSIQQNDDHAGGFDFAAVGAFPLSGAFPRDAVVFEPALASGSYSIQIAGKNNATGIALAEIYDITPAEAFTTTTARLVNVSARTPVGSGDDILIAGFSIDGSGPLRLLIRAAGPTLAIAPFSVDGTLADPKLEIYSGSTKITENDNWGGTAELKAAFASVAAFGFSADNSRDAAVVATLQPGAYTAQISGVNNSTGVALVEVYELR